MKNAHIEEMESLEGEVSGALSTVRVAVVGATGYAGRELIAILSGHPRARVARLMSSGRGRAGAFLIEQVHPVLRSHSAKQPLECTPLDIESLRPAEIDAVFLATPHEISHELVPMLLGRNLRVIDLSGAFRLKDADAYPTWYGFKHRAAEALADAVYGAPELNHGAIENASLVANPGCYATSINLALAALLQSEWLDVGAGIVCDSKSGASGAGRTPSDKLHFAEVNENCRAYSPFRHRHVPEMLQTLGLRAEHFLFTPHLLPVTRGILSTIYVRLNQARSLEEVRARYMTFYARAPMVRIYTDGSLPEIQSAAYTNFLDLGFALESSGQRLIIVSAEDNLGKGAAGQAVQNMNVMMGFEEEAGLL